MFRLLLLKCSNFYRAGTKSFLELRPKKCLTSYYVKRNMNIRAIYFFMNKDDCAYEMPKSPIGDAETYNQLESGMIA